MTSRLSSKEERVREVGVEPRWVGCLPVLVEGCRKDYCGVPLGTVSVAEKQNFFAESV